MLLGSGPEPTRADLRRNKVCEYFLTSQHSSYHKNQLNRFEYNKYYNNLNIYVNSSTYIGYTREVKQMKLENLAVLRASNP